ncbi:RND transporter [Lutimaribacter sp. EGI FJ00015]|uniref:RND transporter n=1 Tax=Lutimaribacter degradans TaxID=2945989 RepID=A0ACC5ZT83_9RHOB|nr:RND transporter [Lutimaribacter sp. EGI FJ00013]MCM2561153.1 RND transporter [Lutimaribacter sp. EGI FJ00013]MCO0611898.1 RND transporter [Lutimaribacter sp. EGI FJ00015]MCO0634981.1 RND transporter [Lutimaribacter sp. EGI FJ00014]
MKALDSISWVTIVALCVLLGGAPFVPEPHLLEKLRMLVQGTLSQPIDIFDLLMHGAPFLLLFAKIARSMSR